MMAIELEQDKLGVERVAHQESLEAVGESPGDPANLHSQRYVHPSTASRAFFPRLQP